MRLFKDCTTFPWPGPGGGQLFKNALKMARFGPRRGLSGKCPGIHEIRLTRGGPVPPQPRPHEPHLHEPHPQDPHPRDPHPRGHRPPRNWGSGKAKPCPNWISGRRNYARIGVQEGEILPRFGVQRWFGRSLRYNKVNQK